MNVDAGLLGPVRTCVGCRKRQAAFSMVRLTFRVADATVVVDRLGAGRGAWLCPDFRCAVKADKSGGVARTLRTDRRLFGPEPAVEALRAAGVTCSSVV